MAVRIRGIGHGANGEMWVTREFSSATPNESVRIRARNRKCECFIRKPLQPDNLSPQYFGSVDICESHRQKDLGTIL